MESQNHDDDDDDDDDYEDDDDDGNDNDDEDDSSHSLESVSLTPGPKRVVEWRRGRQSPVTHAQAEGAFPLDRR